MKKMRVGVIMGGKSAEHEVSFNSGRTVCDHLDTSRYDVVPIFQTRSGILYLLPWRFLHRGKTSDFEHRLAQEAQIITWDALKNLIDFMFIAVHGQFAEDGTLQGMLEVLGIPYLGSKVFASALSMDKIVQKTFLAQHGIKTPRGISLSPEEIFTLDTNQETARRPFDTSAFAKASGGHSGRAGEDKIRADLETAQLISQSLNVNGEKCASLQTIVEKLAHAGLQLPYIVKPYKEGSSLGVRVVKELSELQDALVHACTINKSGAQAVLIEEKLEGMEFSCITITDTKTGELLALPPTEIIPEHGTQFFDYQQKYMPGRAHKRTPPNCSPEIIQKIQATCVATTRALGITNFSRVDGFVTRTGDVVIIDPNSLSGMDPASFLFREAAEVNMSHSQVINHLIKTELDYYKLARDNHENLNSENKLPMNSKKIRVAVLMGGDSNEREISLASGRNITYKLSPEKYEAIPVFVTDTMELYKISQSLLVRSSTAEIQSLLSSGNTSSLVNTNSSSHIAWSALPEIADFVFLGLHGGKGENGSVQGTLEMLGLPYNGSGVLTSSLCMDKYKTAQFLHAHGFNVPAEYLVTLEDWQTNSSSVLAAIENSIAYPLIVKPADDGCSVLVQKITNRSELEDAVNAIFARDKVTALVEEFVTGMELTVGVIGNSTPQALPPSQTVVQKDILSIEEKFLPGAGENQTPAPLPHAALDLVRQVIASAYKALGCKGYARIDCFYQAATQSPTGSERVVILEVNTLPGMTPATCLFHQAAEVNIRPMEFIDQIIEYGFQAHAKQLTKNPEVPTLSTPEL
jgi:UDP-N-acetylmuramate--alanine ligase